jgi:uncharacterized repeat protein (TIGR03803 family)
MCKIAGDNPMKTNVKPFRFIMALLSLGTCATAQTPTTLVNFNYSDGANPQAGLVASGGTLYGTTYAGGASGYGTVFAINTNASGFTNVYSFTGGSDGANPEAGLVLSGYMLYGTTELGGSNYGTVFAVNTNGGGFTNIYSFNGGGDGADPEAGLVLSGNTLFGTTFIGGQFGEGSVFRVNTDGTAFTNIYSFSGSNGANPEAGLVLSGNTLYGTTYAGGSSGYGTVFSVNTDGSSPGNVHSFTGGGDGANPQAGLVLAGGTLYGTAFWGGHYDYGTVFSVNTNGSNFQSCLFEYSNGANPQAGLLLVGNTLYGTTTNGGDDGYGTVFQVSTNLGGLTNLYAFSYGSDGANPAAGLVLSGNTLYGTTQTSYDGNGYGTVFALNVPGLAVTLNPTLNITLNGGQVTLTWANAAFSLQSAPTVAGVYTNVPGATSPYTTAATGAQQFFRMQENLAPTLYIALQGGQVTLTWNNPAFSLQSATNVAGVYTNVANATSPYTNAITGAQQFFRLQEN